MKIFKTFKLEELIKKSADITGKRTYQRLPVNIPVLYGFPDKKNIEGEFRQCSSLDISNGGIAIEIIDPPADLLNNQLVNNNTISLRADLPGQTDLLEFTGIIRWIKEAKTASHSRYIFGVEFVEIDPDHKISLISHAIHLFRRKKIIKFSIITLGVLICIVTGWGISNQISKSKVDKKLVISETARTGLENDIKELSAMKRKLDEELKDSSEKIEKTIQLLEKKEKQMKETEKNLKKIEKTLTDKEDDLEKVRKKMKEQDREMQIVSEKMKTARKIMSQLEERIYNYIVSSGEELVFLTSKTDTSIFSNEDYKAAQNSLKLKKCDEAVQHFQKVTAAFTDSPVGFSGLMKAYYCAGNTVKARETFKQFLNLQEKEMDLE